MKRYGLRGVSMVFATSLMLALAGCGTSTGERAASGAGVGAAVGGAAGAVTGGSVVKGAAIGAGAGAVTGAATDEDDIDLDD